LVNAKAQAIEVCYNPDSIHSAVHPRSFPLSHRMSRRQRKQRWTTRRRMPRRTMNERRS
jgi:hypothetical protein